MVACALSASVTPDTVLAVRYRFSTESAPPEKRARQRSSRSFNCARLLSCSSTAAKQVIRMVRSVRIKPMFTSRISTAPHFSREEGRAKSEGS